MGEAFDSRMQYIANEWLADYHREQGDDKQTLKFEEANFLQRPWLKDYQRIHQVAERIGSWAKVRSRLLKHLKQSEKWSVLVEIAIYERDATQAIKLLKKLPTHQQATFKPAIAQVSEPEMAVALYQELVHTAIQRKNRLAYQEAIQYLQVMQKIQKLAKTSKAWKHYIQGIREQYPTLKALHSELERL
jgi:uncharacterized Zn finger protein